MSSRVLVSSVFFLSLNHSFVHDAEDEINAGFSFYIESESFYSDKNMKHIECTVHVFAECATG